VWCYKIVIVFRRMACQDSCYWTRRGHSAAIFVVVVRQCQSMRSSAEAVQHGKYCQEKHGVRATVLRNKLLQLQTVTPRRCYVSQVRFLFIKTMHICHYIYAKFLPQHECSCMCIKQLLEGSRGVHGYKLTRSFLSSD
jgi:hypothetical protein